MPWNSTWPIGGISVKANRTAGNQNTTYIETTMGNDIVGTNTTTMRDHFWNVGSNEDGRHRMIQSPAFTVGGNPADPVLGVGMDAVLYAKTTNGTVQWFSRNAALIEQVTPTLLSGTVVVASSSSYNAIVAVPANVYGEIYMWRDTAGNHTAQQGFFRSTGAVVEAWSFYLGIQGGSSGENLKFGNGSEASGLTIQVRADEASSGNTWNYRIKYWAI